MTDTNDGWVYYTPKVEGDSPEDYTHGDDVWFSLGDTKYWMPTSLPIWETGCCYRYKPPNRPKPKLTGGSSDYYKLMIGGRIVECQEVIEALNMTFSEGNVFKAVWRIAAERQGNGKPGTTALYDSEKIVFFGERLVAKNTPDKGE